MEHYEIGVETEADFAGIYALIETAFSTAKVSDGDEQDFANKLRAGSAYIPELALVAHSAEGLIGHIMLTKIYITLPDQKGYEGLLLAPISVLLEWRDKGVGSALIREAFQRASAMGYGAVFLCGDPGYYGRFGFDTIASFGIQNTNEIAEQYALCCELKLGALSGVTGAIDYMEGVSGEV